MQISEYNIVIYVLNLNLRNKISISNLSQNIQHDNENNSKTWKNTLTLYLDFWFKTKASYLKVHHIELIAALVSM